MFLPKELSISRSKNVVKVSIYFAYTLMLFITISIALYSVHDGFFNSTMLFFEELLLYIMCLKLNMFYKQICELSCTAI